MSSKNFKNSETNCNCGCQLNVMIQVNMMLELVRAWAKVFYNTVNVAVIVTSGARCRYWNDHEEGYKNSEHMYSIACDFKVKYKANGKWEQVPPKMVYDFLNRMFPNSMGLGVYDTFTHGDLREKKSRWDERTKK